MEKKRIITAQEKRGLFETKGENGWKKAGKYLLKAVVYPVSGALPNKTQEYLEKRYEGYNKETAATVSSYAEALAGCALLYIVGPAAVVGVGEGLVRALKPMGNNDRLMDIHISKGVEAYHTAEADPENHKVYGLLAGELLEKLIHKAYDKIYEKWGKT